jgi:hypothetical protein
MKVHIKIIATDVQKVALGDCFRLPLTQTDSNVYMVIDGRESPMDIRAVCLNNGKTFIFLRNRRVIPIDMEAREV